MAESYSQQYRGKVTHVYLGEGKPEQGKPEKTKADTLYNTHMQELFDIVAPEAVAQRGEAAGAQAEISMATAELLKNKSSSWQRYKEHKDFKKFINDLDIEWRGRELPHKLERILLFGMMGSMSAGIDFSGETLAAHTFLKKKDGHLIDWGKVKLVPLDNDDTRGNRKAIKAGWEMLTDHLIGSFTDKSVALTTNRTDVRFVSPLSDSLSKVGAVVSSVLTPRDEKPIHRFLTALVNPSTIESGFRALSAIPVVGGKVENVYIALNKQLLGGEGLLPFGFDLSITMLAAKEKQMKDVQLVRDVSKGP